MLASLPVPDNMLEFLVISLPSHVRKIQISSAEILQAENILRPIMEQKNMEEESLKIARAAVYILCRTIL